MASGQVSAKCGCSQPARFILLSSRSEADDTEAHWIRAIVGVNLGTKRVLNTILVIKAHQHSSLETSIRSNSDFWKYIHSSAIVDSPKVCKNGLIPKFTASPTQLTWEKR